jgi:hypothetical protein
MRTVQPVVVEDSHDQESNKEQGALPLLIADLISSLEVARRRQSEDNHTTPTLSPVI